MFTWLQLMFAGLGSMIWHWGLGVGLIIILVAAAEFSTMVPIIGPWLEKVRKDLLWVAVAIALVLVGEYIGANDANKRCDAKASVIERTVDKAVLEADTNKNTRKDKWDTDR